MPIPTRNKGIDALPGLSAVMNMYHGLRPNLHVALYVPTMYDARRGHDRDMLELIRSRLSPVADPLPQRESIWMDSGLAGVPVSAFAPSSKVADDVRQLTRQIAGVLELPYPEPTA